MERDTGINQVIEIANRLIIDRVNRESGSQRRPERVFLSFAHQDAETANALASSLGKRQIEVLIGDAEIRSDQMIPVSIEQALLRSDVCAVLWSRNYALSQYCFDELDLAINRQSLGRMTVWLFNLDDSTIVPTHARKLPAISLRNPQSVDTIVDELLSED